MNPRVVILCLVFCVVASVRAQHAYRQLREFGFVELAASQPLSGVVEGPGGWLYGTSQGGTGGLIYRVKKDGTGFSILFDFAGTNGTPSRGTLVLGSDGALYGTVIMPFGFEGAIYRIQPDGTGFELHVFGFGEQIISGLIEGADGRLYGTTFGGGVYEGGTVFGINKDGSGFALLHNFAGGPNDGYQPIAEPLEGSDGHLYIATSAGGPGNAGVVCRMSRTGSDFLVLHRFPASGTNDGRLPNSGLAEGPGGNLYGTTQAGGTDGEEDFFSGYGVVYRVSNDGDVYTVLRRFEGGINDGQRPKDIFMGSDGQLYGTSQNAGYARNVDGIFRMDTLGNGFGLIYTWVTGDNQTIQLNPVFESVDGNFYGTSAGGGSSNLGQAFKVRPNGTQYQSLHEFSPVGGDGRLPWALLRDSDGALYGSTLGGGASDKGTIYKLESNGSYRILHQFEGESGFPLGLVAASDGFLYGSDYYSHDIFRLSKDGLTYVSLTNLAGSPVGNLIEGSDFLLYGVTEDGGTTELGSVFRMNPDGTDLQEIHSFTSISTNLVVPAGIIEGSDGKLWGTALRGGASDQGMVFRLNKDGSQYQILRSFTTAVGTVSPNPLMQASDSYFYGTTYRGGANGQGTIYRVHISGDPAFVNDFPSGRGNPVGKLAEGPGGWLYGVTQESGNFGGGHLFRFKIGASPIYILHHFGEGSLGRDPGTGVVLGPAGEIYGTTQYGGFSAGYGTIFRVDVRPVLSIQRAGPNVEISWPWNGERYNLQATHNLGLPWAFHSLGPANVGERVTATIPPGSAAQFYRLEKAQ